MKAVSLRLKMWLIAGLAVLVIVANYVTARFGAAPSHLTAGDVARFRQWSSQ